MKTIKFVDENLVGQPGLCPFISPNVNWLRETPNYDICIYTDRLCFNNIDETKSNYAWILEPPIINGENYRDIVKIASKFKKVFSHNKNLETKIQNFTYCAHGGTWLSENEINTNLDKKENLISYLFSDKQWNSYHRLRHITYEILKNQNVPNKDKITYFGSGCNNRIDRKSQALSSFMFSIVIENSEEDDYFTEKLLDCLLSGVIPIYMGTKNIGNYFDIEGIIRFTGPEQLPDILSKLDTNFYMSKTNIINKNFELAKNYIHPEHLISKTIEENE